MGRLQPRRVTLRARLTLVYGGLFLAAGTVLLGITYALFNQQLASGGSGLSLHSEGRPPVAGTAAPRPVRDSGPSTSSFEDKERQRLNKAAVTTLITQGGIALGVVGSAAGGLGRLIAGRVLAPLHRVTDTAARIAADPSADRGLHERIALAGPEDEVKDLADTFDTMIEHLDRSFDGQRRFVANASHERLISGLLLLAGAENHIPEPIPVDLADVSGKRTPSQGKASSFHR